MKHHFLLLDVLVKGGIMFLIYFPPLYFPSIFTFLICIFMNFPSDPAETQTNLIRLEGE